MNERFEELTKRGNFVPMELVTALGAEHNDVQPEYQSEVARCSKWPSGRKPCN